MTVPGGGKRPRPGGLWLLLAPAACCAGPLLATGLATAGALARSGLGLAVRRRKKSAAGRCGALAGRLERLADPLPAACLVVHGPHQMRS